MRIKYLLTISRPLLKVYKTLHLLVSSSAGGVGSGRMAAAPRSTTTSIISFRIKQKLTNIKLQEAVGNSTYLTEGSGNAASLLLRKKTLTGSSAFESPPPLDWIEIFSRIYLVKIKTGWLYFQDFLQIRYRGVKFLRSEVIVSLWTQPAEIRYCRS